MERIDINNRPMCKTCGAPVHHNGSNWEASNNSLERSALSGPLVNGQQAESYKNILAEVESTRRAGGWKHTDRNLSHDAAPHDNRTPEQEEDRFGRVLENEPEHVKAIRAMLRGTPKTEKAAEPAEKPKVPTVEELMADASPEELAKWNRFSSNKLGQ